MVSPQPDRPGRGQYVRNVTLAVVAGQVGCLTLVIVLAAVFGGLWLDNRFDSKPLYTIGLVLASIPVSLAVMFFVARAAISKIKAENSPRHSNVTEEGDFGRNRRSETP